MENKSTVLKAANNMIEKIDWDSVYTAELPRVYNFFIYKVADKEFAEELTAITFERAWKNRHRYRSTIAATSTWLFGIAKNVLKEHLRKRRLRGQRFLPITQNIENTSNSNIEKNIQQQQEKDLLREIILELPDREQNLISLKYGAGLTNREISKITHISESNVGTILHRTVKKVRARLEDYHE